MQGKFVKILISCLLYAGTVQAEDLVELYHVASESDPTVRAAREQYKASAQAVPKALASFLPDISGTIDSAANESSDRTFMHNNTWSFTLNISQPIFRMRDWSQYGTAKYEVEAALATLNNVEQQLFLRIAEQYFTILKAYDNHAFAKGERRAFARQLEQVEQRFKVGLIAVTDVHEARSKRDNAFSREISAENEIANARERLREIIGFADSGTQDLKDNVNFKHPIPNNMEQWVRRSLDNNWELQALRHNLEVARQKIKVSKSGHMPELFLISSVVRNKLPPPTATKATNKNATIRLNIPVFSGGGVSAAAQENIHLYAKTGVELEKIHRTVESNTRQSFRNISNKIAQIEALKQTVISSKSALQAIKSAYDVGTRTVVDVLDAESALLQAERDYSQARYDYVIELLKLKQLAGSLNIADITEVNGWLKSVKKLGQSPKR